MEFTEIEGERKGSKVLGTPIYGNVEKPYMQLLLMQRRTCCDLKIIARLHDLEQGKMS